MIYPIVKYGNPVLEKTAEKVTVFDAELEKLIEDMFESMYEAHGVGLAAPQIGIGRRIAVIDVTFKEDPKAKLVLINPEIIKASGEQIGPEGCLSIPGYIGENSKRSMMVLVKGRDVHGKEMRVRADSFFARILQHEIDHLDGILYLDRLQRPEDLRRLLEDEETGEVKPESSKTPGKAEIAGATSSPTESSTN